MEPRRSILRRMIVGVVIGTTLSVVCAVVGPAVSGLSITNAGCEWATRRESALSVMYRDIVDDKALDGTVEAERIRSLQFRLNAPPPFLAGFGAYFPHDGEFVLVDSGWPARSLAGWGLRSSTYPTFVRGDADDHLPPPKLTVIRSVPAVSSSSGLFSLYAFWSRRGEVVHIPYQPIPLGLLINAAAWSAPICLLLLLTMRSRCARRRRLGQCLTCGYDLRATPAEKPCPECGHLSRARSVTAPAV